MLRDILLSAGGKRCLSTLLAFIVCANLPAFAAGRPNVDSGTIADSVKERQIAVPPKNNVKIEVGEEEQETSIQKTGYKIKVNRFRITGQTIYQEEKLQELIKDVNNQELTLSELETVARRISKYFRVQGYMVAKAYIPAQDIKDGVVEITVVPGRYGSLDIRNHSRLATNVAAKMLSSIQRGNYVKKDKLERALLLMSDTGGISIKATLAPGKTAGTTDLIIEINNTNEATAELSMDNYGNRYTGQNRRNLNLHLNNLSGTGDIATISGNNSGGGLTNYDIGYTLPVGRQGARLGVGYSHLHYTLGENFEGLNFNGTAKTSSIYGLYPLIRTRNHNLYAQIEYDHRKLEDHEFNSAITNKHTDAWTFGLSGDSRDKFHGGGINSYVLTVSSGRLVFDGGQDIYGNPVQEDDSKTARSAGSYTKTNLNFNRLQYINKHLNFYFGFTGQLANKNLDSSEKLFIGGANAVRAYPQGEASGDQGYLVTGELRWSLPAPSLQLAAFIDHGRVTINKNPWAGAGDNARSLTGIGLGVILNSRKDYTVRVDYAWKLNSGPATSDTDRNGRWWLRGVQYF